MGPEVYETRNHPSIFGDLMADERDDIKHRAARLTEPMDALSEGVRARVSDPAFALALRGYDRAAVDAYVERVTRIVAELEASRSPREAVRQALERVGEETTDILRRAHDTGEEITSKARAEAEELRARTEADADELRSRTKAETDELRTRTATAAEALSAESREEAEARLTKAREEAEALDVSSREEAERMLENSKRKAHASVAGIEQRLVELDGEVDVVWSERQRLIGDIEQLSRDLRGLAREAEVRFPAEAPPAPYESRPEETVEMSNELPEAVPDRS
jgi:DivIVA domain-containing protein